MPLKSHTTARAPRDRFEDHGNWRLVDTDRALELFLGDKAKTNKGEHVEILQTHPPLKVSSHGKVTVRFTNPGIERKITTLTYYASVIGCEFQYVGDLS